MLAHVSRSPAAAGCQTVGSPHCTPAHISSHSLNPPTFTLQNAAAASRQRHARMMVAASATAAAFLLLLATGSGLQQTELTAVHGTVLDALALPADAAVAAAAAGAQRTTGGGWLHLAQQKLADQEARLQGWREQQRALVYEETAEEEQHGTGSAARWAGALSAAAAATAADPMLDADQVVHGLSAVAAAERLQLTPLRNELQATAAAEAEAAGRGGSLADE